MDLLAVAPISVFDVICLGFGFTRRTFMRGGPLLQVAPQVNIQGDCHAHYDERTHTQNQKPPDHPHSRL